VIFYIQKTCELYFKKAGVIAPIQYGYNIARTANLKKRSIKNIARTNVSTKSPSSKALKQLYRISYIRLIDLLCFRYNAFYEGDNLMRYALFSLHYNFVSLDFSGN
jgi:hypothetical protein